MPEKTSNSLNGGWVRQLVLFCIKMHIRDEVLRRRITIEKRFEDRRYVPLWVIVASSTSGVVGYGYSKKCIILPE
ncbi:hypothetical protein Tco_1142274 [Tanacetum coccineum]